MSMAPPLTFRLLALAAACVLLVAGVLLIFASHRQPVGECLPFLPPQVLQTTIANLDHNAGAGIYSTTTSDLQGRSTEGGIQTTFRHRSQRVIVEQSFYGETGRSILRFYYIHDKIAAIVQLTSLYTVPLSADSTPTIASTTDNEFVLSMQGSVCAWYSNGSAQRVTNDTNDMIADFINHIVP